MVAIGGRMGYRTVFTQKKTYEQVNQLVKNKQVDLAFVCAGPYVTGHRDFGMELLVVPVAHGEKVYYSYLLAGTGAEFYLFLWFGEVFLQGTSPFFMDTPAMSYIIVVGNVSEY